MRTVALLPGEAPDLVAAARRAVDATGVRLAWADAAPDAPALRAYRAVLKAPLGYAADRALRKDLDCFAGIRLCASLEGVPARFPDVDLVVVRENLEGPSVTPEGARRIAHAAFEHAAMNARRRVTVAHRDDALFLEVARDAAKDWPQIEVEDRSLDGLMEDLARRPQDFDVLLCPDRHGDALTDLCVSLAGGPGTAAGVNRGEGIALFEPAGATASGPLPLLLAACLLLDHLHEPRAADRLRRAVGRVLAEGRNLTPDLGGSAPASALVEAVLGALGP